MSNSLSKVFTFKVLYSLMLESRLNKASVAFADKSSRAFSFWFQFFGAVFASKG